MKHKEIKNAILRAKPELNFLYRTEPFETSSGIDYGWFCREHALHVFLLLALFKAKAVFTRGHVYGLFTADDTPLQTLESGADHWWGVSDFAKPIDLSITPDHITSGTLDYVWDKPEPSIDFAYVDSEQAFRSRINRFRKGIGLAYYEQAKIEINPVELLETPSRVVIIPPDGGIQVTIHPDIFSAITLHLWDIAIGQGKPLKDRLTRWDEAMRVIAIQNPLAKERLKRLLQS